jgi:toxin ParE1/3/4
MAQLVLSRQVDTVLDEIEEYSTRIWGNAQAERYIHAIFQSFDLIADNPDLGHYRSNLPFPYLSYSVGSHVIIYRYDQLSNQVEVLTLLHPAMDIAVQVRSLLMRPLYKKL